MGRFSCSYSEAVIVDYSAIVWEKASSPIKHSLLMQFVFDNADMNVNTIDGENTFHKMGGIMIITPHSSVLPNKNISCLKMYVSADSISLYAVSQLKYSSIKRNAGLSTISITDLHEVGSDILPSAPGLVIQKIIEHARYTWLEWVYRTGNT